MPSAEIITIGTEILLGEIVDTNAPFIARCLRDAGIDLFRKTTVGDNAGRIAKVIQEALERCDIVITTGGLGPTVDDPTREAVALAMNVKTEYHHELWQQIESRFQRYGRKPTENNRRQAYIPQGAIAYENTVGTAPIFIFKHQSQAIISLPGVPREMEYLLERVVLPYLQENFDLRSVIKARVIHTVGVGESQIDDLIGDLERYSNPTVGLLAHSGQVDVRVTAKADSLAAAQEMIDPIEEIIRNRLGDCIYGADQDRLEEVALKSISSNNWTLTVIEGGLGINLITRLSKVKDVFIAGQVITEFLSPDELMQRTVMYRTQQNADVGLGVVILPQEDKQDIHIALITPIEQHQYARSYGGAPDNAPIWAMNQSLDILRRIKNEQ
jgi:competence/damage-inducible protein CinA-like protein